jgi:hypothetical protein
MDRFRTTSSAGSAAALPPATGAQLRQLPRIAGIGF